MTNLIKQTLEQTKRDYNLFKELYEDECDCVNEYNEKNKTGLIDENRKFVDFQVARVVYKNHIYYTKGTELECLNEIAKSLTNRFKNDKVLIEKIKSYKKELFKKIAWQKKSKDSDARSWYKEAIDKFSFIYNNKIDLTIYEIVYKIEKDGIGVYNTKIKDYVSTIFHISHAKHLQRYLCMRLESLIENFIEVVKEVDNTIEIYEMKKNGYDLFSNRYREQKEYVKELFYHTEEELRA